MLEVFDSDEFHDLLIPERKAIGAGVMAKARTLVRVDRIESRLIYRDSEGGSIMFPHLFGISFDGFLREKKDKVKAGGKGKCARTHRTVVTARRDQDPFTNATN